MNITLLHYHRAQKFIKQKVVLPHIPLSSPQATP